MTGLARGKTFAHQIEIGDAVDLVVVGNAGVAVAEAFLGPHVDLDAAAGQGRSGLVRQDLKLNRRL